MNNGNQQGNGGRHGHGGGGNPLGGHANGGYSGLASIIQLLSGGINANQFGRLDAGYTGANGAVGNMHGAFSGLSPWAVHFLTTAPGLLAKQTPTQVATTDAQGNPLTGTSLLMANLQNYINSMAPATYKLADGVTADNLASLFANGVNYQGQNHSAYAKGFGADGRLGPAANH